MRKFISEFEVVWNSLPESVDFGSVVKFKKSIHLIDFSKFLRCFEVYRIVVLILVLVIVLLNLQTLM